MKELDHLGALEEAGFKVVISKIKDSGDSHVC
ncbi:MAG: hypothetical protein BWX92_03696 [Deltaproteobacteria bacterium ADurb.Bin135]|nr:MAG: hypothetical protein BWX92_03696 [Deltaproteobacteria bacterium ADurb.Bin135]